MSVLQWQPNSLDSRDAIATAHGRWLQVVPHLDPSYGGMSAAVPALGRALQTLEGVPVSLAGFCSPAERFLPEGYERDEVSYWSLSRRAWFLDHIRGDKFHRQLEQLLLGVEGIHIHGLWEQSTGLTARMARKLAIPYIVSAHGMLEPWALANKRLKKALYASLFERANLAAAACLHALNRAEADNYIHFGATRPIVIIPNAVALPDHADSSLFLSHFSKLVGKRIVLFMARLHPKKGLDILLDAWAALAGDFQYSVLVIAGPDPDGMRRTLEQTVAHYGLTQQVVFTGMLRDTMKWSALAAAECFVLPSYSEGLSVSVLEAMGMGLPVLVTEQCNMPEVAHKGAGWVIQPTVAEITNGLRKMLTNSTSRNAAVGALGAALVQSEYSWQGVAHKMASVYRWVAGGARPAGVEIMYPEPR